MNITRRGFLQGLGALAATAVVSPSILVPLGKTDLQRFMEMASSGVIRGQTFMFDGPVVLDGMDGLVIDECRFVWKTTRRFGGAALTINHMNLTVTRCCFEASWSPWHAYIGTPDFDWMISISGDDGDGKEVVIDTVELINVDSGKVSA